jgi:hypothetical protein
MNFIFKIPLPSLVFVLQKRIDDQPSISSEMVRGARAYYTKCVLASEVAFRQTVQTYGVCEDYQQGPSK